MLRKKSKYYNINNRLDDILLYFKFKLKKVLTIFLLLQFSIRNLINYRIIRIYFL